MIQSHLPNAVLRSALLVCAFSFIPVITQAQSSTTQTNAAPTLPPPNVATSTQADTEDLDSAIRIRKGRGDKIEEIKRQGKTVSVKVTPANGGPAYFLIDRLGSGQFSIYQNTVDGVVVPTWTLLEW